MPAAPPSLFPVALAAVPVPIGLLVEGIPERMMFFAVPFRVVELALHAMHAPPEVHVIATRGLVWLIRYSIAIVPRSALLLRPPDSARF